MYEAFKAEVERKKRLLNLTNADIGKATGYASTTIDYFMLKNSPRPESRKVGAAIADCFGIEFTESEGEE